MMKLKGKGRAVGMKDLGHAAEAGDERVVISTDTPDSVPSFGTRRAGFRDNQARSSLRSFLQKGDDPIVGRSFLGGKVIIQGSHDDAVLKLQGAMGREQKDSHTGPSI
jgi:hypothetical protein